MQFTFFINGFNEMVKRINPKEIFFCCNKKYKERFKQEKIIFLESFWDNKRKNAK